ncbi:MAG: SDR family oxidoreductase [Proteobacteria bacterium]|nr:SDR family oxidoreductase [Pseudomonadota bacterium]
MPTILITGASSGIGLELTRLYQQQGDDVIAVCRNLSTDLAATKARVIDEIDFLDNASYAVLQEKLDGVSIDILINNAGIFLNETIAEMPFDQISTQFEVNALAPMKVTMALLKNLRHGSKILMTTSRMGSIGDNTGGAYYGYRASKAALNALAVSLSVDLKEQGISVGLVHPGFVKTKMTGFRGDITPLESAKGYLEVVDKLNINNSGGFWHVNGEVLPW